MKRTLLLLNLVITLSIFSQTPEQRDKILQSYDMDRINSLVEKLKSDELQQKEIKNKFLTDTHKIKKLTVLPGKALSLQSHKKRSEHWVVISGVASVIKGNDEFILNKNESTFIPVNTKHRLTNKSKNILVIIEVQTGKYFGEDDIKRYDDIYGRLK